MEITIAQAGIVIAGMFLADWSIKLGKAGPLIKKSFNLIKNQEEARRDGTITDKEKVILYNDIEVFVKEAYSIIKGLLPNRSKVTINSKKQ